MKTLTFLKTHIIHPVLNLESAIQDKAGKSSHLLFYAGGIILAILLRILLFDFETLDYQNFLSPWYDFIKENGGFPALGKDFSNYSPPYLYLLLLAVYLPLKKLYAIKLITVLFDIAAAVLVFLIVRRKYRSFVIPAAASLVFLFTPTVFINSSMWGQCDIIFTFWILASVLFLIRRDYLKAFIFFGIAFSFKLQAVFFLPVFAILYFRRRFPFCYFFIIPAVYIILSVPCLIAGRPFVEILGIYTEQTSVYQWLTINAPSVYQWVSAYTDMINTAAVVFCAAVLLFTGFICSRALKDDKGDNIIRLSLLSLLIVPFLLPQMHERYFFPADVLSVIYAFYFPKYFYVPVLVVLSSYFSYYNYLYSGHEPVIKLSWLALVLLVSIIIVCREMYLNSFGVKIKDRLRN